MTVKSPASASGRKVSPRAAGDTGTASSDTVGTRLPRPPAGEHRAYQPRAPERGVLYTIVSEHLETFLREVAERAEGAGLPHFVEQEFR